MFLRTLKTLCLLIFLIFIYAVLKDKSFFALFKIFQNNDENSTLSSYQQAGRSIFISYLFLAVLNTNKLINLIILLISAIILLSIGSRTDLISIFLVILAFIFHFFFRSSISIVKKLFILFTFIFLMFVMIVFLKQFFFDSRAVEIFDLASSTSWQGRSDLSENAKVIIRNNPIFGKFDYYDSPGGYAHNILSSWTSFGIFGFILYFLLLFYFLSISIFGYFFKSKNNNMWFLVLIFNFISFSQALIAAPIFSALPALGWGLTLNIYIKSKINSKINI
jgi:O-antigen ligase